MRIESVTATAFGPFQGEVLELAPGLTVVHGDNESGKSSWHAAIYAALCGRRRARGRGKLDDSRFAALRRPWVSDSWKVRCVVELDDGRRVELAQDLDGKVDCRAVDMTLGRDISAEIMYDGAPDGSKWLGLNRRTFAATACVEQADLLSVLRAANEMQEDLQRAAATAGRDETAAKALQAIKDFRSERVGLDRANSTKPLRKAKDALDGADRELKQARRQHSEYLGIVAEADTARQLADQERRALRTLEQEVDRAEKLVTAARDARLAGEEAERAASRAGEEADAVAKLKDRSTGAAELLDVLGDYEPVRATADDEVTREVAWAVSAWRSAPAVGQSTGPSSADLQAEIDALPDAPAGDVEVDASVRRCHDAYRDAVAVADSIRRRKPESKTIPRLEGERLQAVAQLASAVAEVRGAEGAETETLERFRLQVTPARHSAAHAASTAKLAIGSLGLAFGLVGLVLIVTGNVLPGLATAIVGVAGVVWAWVLRLSGGSAPGPGPKAGTSTNQAVTAARERLHLARQTSQEAERALARADATLVSTRKAVDDERQAEREVEDRGAVLAESLRNRGCRDVPDVERALETYQRDCQSRADQAREAATRPELIQRLRERHQREHELEQAARVRETAREAVQAAARRVGLDPVSGEEPTHSNDTDRLVADLEARQRQRGEALAADDKRHKSWLHLQTLLDGSDLAGLRQRLGAAQRAETEARQGADQAKAAAERAGACLESSASAAVLDLRVGESAAGGHLQKLKNELARARKTEAELQRKASGLEGHVAERAKTLASVSEAEESLARAKAELGRVEALSDVLDRTERFLGEAQERVFRDIAPVLVKTLDKWLPVVTVERYSRSTVDPETLEVCVASATGDWRNADLLSVGTKEQVYLLLRVALAEHLAKNRAVSPLLLDDVTVQADPTRTCAILNMCKTLAEEGRQVVVFAQEPTVADWAADNLTEPQHKLVRLGQLTTT
jgi:exonuclease SbcC